MTERRIVINQGRVTMNSPISGSPNYWGPIGRDPRETEKPKAAKPVAEGDNYDSTPQLMELCAEVMLHPEKHTASHRKWLAGQLKQRAAELETQ